MTHEPTHAQYVVDQVVRDASDQKVRLAWEEITAELERLRPIERRAEECSTWCGLDGMHRAVRYIQTGEITP